jgi:hypothetical protein
VFANSPTLVTPALGTPASGVVTNLTGTASININGTVGATTPSTGAFTTLSSTTDLTLNDGTANSPNINFQTTSGTRIMDMDGSTIRILNMAASNARLQLTDAGNLTVDGSISSTGLAVTGALSSTTGANFATSSGNVGIGAAAVAGAASRLRVVGGSDLNTGISMGSSASDRPTLGFRVADNSQRVKIEVNDVNAATGDRLGFFVSPNPTVEMVSMRGNGNVGIGTSSPTMRLAIDGTGFGGLSIKSTSTNYSGILIENTNSATKWQIGVEGGQFVTAGKLNIGIDGVGPAVVIDSSRDVGIGTTTPGSKLDVNGELRIGNTVNTVSPTSPDRTITMVIGGTTYYIHAKTTND